MKKRILSLLLAIAMLAAMVVVPVSAEEAEAPVITGETADAATPVDQMCPCDCGQVLADINWQKWDPNTIGHPVSGHYYLDGNYLQDSYAKVISGDRVVLDLRGCDLTTKEMGRALLNYGYVAVLDTVGGGRFMAKSSGGGRGGVVMVACNETNDPTFELHSGTIMQDPDSKGSSSGGLISIGQNSTFRMTGGMLVSGTTYNEDGNVRDGGAVYASSSSAVLEITGGQIIGCKASGNGGSIYSVGTTILRNCTITGGDAAVSGGNIYQEGGKLTIENCTISHGAAGDPKNGGGNVAIFGSAKAEIRDSILENGYSVYHGGNLFVKTATALVERTQIYGGVAKARGGNVYTTTDCAGITIRDCTFPGDLTFAGKKSVLEGQVKIGLLNNGLDVTISTSTSRMIDAKGLTEGSEIYIEAQSLFAEPGVNKDYFKGAIRTVITETEEGLAGTQAASGELGGYCPHCGDRVTWVAYDPANQLAANCYLDKADDTDPVCTGRHLETGHYFLEADLTNQNMYYAGSREGSVRVQKDVVIDLNGKDLSAKARAFYINPVNAGETIKSALTLLDSYGGGGVYAKGKNDSQGGVIYNESGILTIYGGTYQLIATEGVTVLTGGVLCNSGLVRMYGGIMDGTQMYNEDTRGGTINGVNSANATFEIYGGCVLGGTAQTGGGICFGGNNKVRISGGQFRGGTAHYSEGGGGGGGAIRIYGSDSYKKADVEIKNASITGGTVTSGSAGGSNLSIGYGTILLKNTYIADGYSTAYGGNITIGTSGNVTIRDCIILGGTADTNGGNINVSSTNSNPIIENSLILCGKAAEYGGNLNIAHGNNVIKGGLVAYGVAKVGGNIRTSAGNYSATSTNHTTLQANEEGSAARIIGGKSTSFGGNLFVSGVLNLENSIINNGTGSKGKDIYYDDASKQGKLFVAPTQTDGFLLQTAASLLGTPAYGNVIIDTECTQLNAPILLESLEQRLCTLNDQLCVGAATVTDEVGVVTVYASNADAVADCGTDGVVTLYTGDPLVLTKDLSIDLNGQTVAVSGAYTVTCGDTAGGGKVILSEETKALQDNYVFGSKYMAMGEGNTYTYHAMNMRITGVALRPEDAGIYFTAQWNCSDTVTELVESYGVAVSLNGDPTTEFISNEDVLYTSFEGLGKTAEKNSCLISDIFKESTPDENQSRGEMPIYAKAYVRMKDGTVFVSDETVSYSLYSVMDLLNQQIETDPMNYRKYTRPARDFYESWQGKGSENWLFSKICAPEKDDIIDVLMVGSSFCSYYVQELYGLAKAAGVKMRVCNVYYSGCKLEQHYTWWVNGVSNYQYFETFSDAGRVRTPSVGLEWCLAQHDWDVITIQESTSRIFTNTAEKYLETSRKWYTALINYFKQEFPDATIGWHQPWTYQIGTTTNGDVMESFEQQEAYEQEIREFAMAVCEEFDLLRINTGDAWQIVRSEYDYDNLCARLGKGDNHEGDYYHDGDIGGGQYLNACVWFEAITGMSSVGVPYAPTWPYQGKNYSLDPDITFAELQEAAHKAVQSLRAEEAVQ